MYLTYIEIGDYKNEKKHSSKNDYFCIRIYLGNNIQQLVKY